MDQDSFVRSRLRVLLLAAPFVLGCAGVQQSVEATEPDIAALGKSTPVAASAASSATSRPPLREPGSSH